MPAKNPRVNVVLEKPLYEDVRKLARRDGVSLSLKVRDLVKAALERNENYGLASVARERARTFQRDESLSHGEVLRHLGTGKPLAWPDHVDWENDPITKLAGFVDSGTPDGAAEHDHYIYGVPKRRRWKK